MELLTNELNEFMKVGEKETNTNEIKKETYFECYKHLVLIEMNE